MEKLQTFHSRRVGSADAVPGHGSDGVLLTVLFRGEGGERDQVQVHSRGLLVGPHHHDNGEEGITSSIRLIATRETSVSWHVSNVFSCSSYATPLTELDMSERPRLASDFLSSLSSTHRFFLLVSLSPFLLANKRIWSKHHHHGRQI